MEKNSCRVYIDFDGSAMIAKLSGELDHHGAVAVRTFIDSEICRLSPQKTVLDLSALDFMDSSGLGLILGRYAEVKKLGGDMVVINPNKNVMKILKLAGAERMIKIEKVDLDRKKDLDGKER